MNTQEFRKLIEQRKGKKEQLTQDLAEYQTRIKETRRDLVRHEQAREIIREVGLKTQQSLQYHISDVTSTALEAVFPDPYQLVVEFVQRRNKTECDIYFMRDDNRVDPLEASGIGAVDIATFALRIASWLLQTPRTQNVIILDEPFKCLSENYQEHASLMLKEISKRLGIQFIIVTHETTLTKAADKIFEVRSEKKKINKKLYQISIVSEN